MSSRAERRVGTPHACPEMFVPMLWDDAAPVSRGASEWCSRGARHHASSPSSSSSSAAAAFRAPFSHASLSRLAHGSRAVFASPSQQAAPSMLRCSFYAPSSCSDVRGVRAHRRVSKRKRHREPPGLPVRHAGPVFGAQPQPRAATHIYTWGSSVNKKAGLSSSRLML